MLGVSGGVVVGEAAMLGLLGSMDRLNGRSAARDEMGASGGAMMLEMPPTAPLPAGAADCEARGGSCINESGGC